MKAILKILTALAFSIVLSVSVAAQNGGKPRPTPKKKKDPPVIPVEPKKRPPKDKKKQPKRPPGEFEFAIKED